LESVLGRGARELEQRLLNTHNPVLLLAEWLDVPAAPPSPIQQAIAAMVRANGQVNLERIAEQAGLSPRHFRRRCLEESGLTPRHLARVLRFRHALALGAQSRRNWASIAAEAGYFDQAHMIRDFREFTGSTPMAVFSNPELHAVL
jgi:transcriptional regulator GlxA family with amidase domain